MKNKQNYWEFMYSGLKPLFRILVVMTLVFLMMIGFLGLFHKFIISQPLLGPHDLFSDLGNLIFMPFIDFIKIRTGAIVKPPKPRLKPIARTFKND